MFDQSITRIHLRIIAALFGCFVGLQPLMSQTPDFLRLKAKGDSLWSSEPEEALQVFSEAILLLDTAQQPDQLADGHFGLAKTFYVLADYNNSYVQFEAGLKYARQTGNTHRIIYGLNGCGIALTMLKQPDEAIEKHLEAIKLCMEDQDSIQWAKNLFNISIAFDEMDDFGQSKIYVDSALSMAYCCESINVICQYRNHQAYLEIEFGHFEKAVEIFKDILQTEGFTNEWERQYSIAGIAKAYTGLNQPHESIKHGLKAFEMASRIKSKWDIMEVSRNLSVAYENTGDYEQALKFFKISKENSDSIYNERSEKELNFHLLTEERLESDYLRLQNDSYQKEIRRKNTIIISFILLFTFLLVFLIVFARMWREKNQLLNTIRADQLLIEEQKTKLEKLNQYKDQILKIIGHDLKNPLGVMIEFTELLQENLDDYSKEKIKTYLQQLNSSSWQGFSLVNNLLNWAQVQTGELPFDPQDISLAAALGHITSILEPHATLKNLVFESKFADDLQVYADEFQLKTILRNLLSNAIKYSYPESTISIEAEKKGHETQICIVDQGVGMKGETMSKILHSEHLESQPGTNNEKGTGLGLNLCKELVYKHKGRIWFENNALQGTRVCVRLPDHS